MPYTKFKFNLNKGFKPPYNKAFPSIARRAIDEAGGARLVFGNLPEGASGRTSGILGAGQPTVRFPKSGADAGTLRHEAVHVKQMHNPLLSLLPTVGELLKMAGHMDVVEQLYWHLLEAPAYHAQGFHAFSVLKGMIGKIPPR